MSDSHAIFYHGPFEVNFKAQKPGQTSYTKRDGKTTAPYRGPSGVRGLRFGLMQKRDGAFVITRVRSHVADVCLRKPIPAQGTGPDGTWLTRHGAELYLDAAVKVNPGKRAQLHALRALL
jgi:hypothetical protein